MKNKKKSQEKKKVVKSKINKNKIKMIEIGPNKSILTANTN